MNVLDLFSGIGGFSLGLERAGMRTIGFCEIDPYCRAVLRKHWPGVPIWDDIRTLSGEQFTSADVDLICGGFPCQPFSSAARGRNTPDNFLWPEMLRVIQEVRPAWVCAENVDAIDRLALETVVSDLEANGYETAPPLVIPAASVGLDHRRNRYWFIGYSDRYGKSSGTKYAKASGMYRRGGESGSLGAEDGISGRMDRLRALGNAIVPQITEIIGRAIMRAT